MAKKRLNKKLLMILAVAGGSVLVIGLVLFVQYRYRDPLPFFEKARELVKQVRQAQEGIEAEVSQIDDPEQAHLRRLELKDMDGFRQLRKEANDEFSHAFGYSRNDIDLKTEVGVELAEYYLMVKDYRHARGVWAKLVEINPSFTPAKYQQVKAIYDICKVGALYAPSVANWTELRKQTEGYIAIAPEEAYGYELKARAMLGIFQAGGDENPERSFEELDTLVAQVEQFGGPSVFLYDLQGQLAQARAEQSLDDHEKADYLTQAEKAYQKAIDTFSDDPQGYYNRFYRYDSSIVRERFSQVSSSAFVESRDVLRAEAREVLAEVLGRINPVIARFPDQGRFYHLKAKLQLIDVDIYALDPVIAIYQQAVTAEPDEPKWAVELGALYRLRALHTEPNLEELKTGFEFLRRALFLPKALDQEGSDRMEIITYRVRNLQNQINLGVALVENSTDDTEKDYYLSIAKRCFAEVRDIIGTHNPNVKILQGTMARAEGNFEEAVKLYYEAEQELTTQGAINPVLNLQLFYVLRETPNRSLSLKHATAAAQAGHRSPKLLMDFMETLDRIGNQSAMIQMNQIVEFFEKTYSPTVAQKKIISTYKAKALLALGEKEAASEALESMDGDSFEVKMLQAQTNENLEQRVALLESLAQDYPGKDRLVFELFSYYFNQGQEDASYYDKARDLIDDSLKHKPDSLGYQQMRAMLEQDDPGNLDPQALQAKYVELAKNISDPLKREKQLGRMLGQLATSYAAKGDVEAAKETFRQAREHFLAAYELENENVELLVQAFKVSLTLEDWDEAQAVAGRAVKVDSLRGQLLNSEYHLARKQWKEAFELLELIRVDHPASGEVCIQLAQAYVGLSDPVKAMKEVYDALELDATDIKAKKILLLLLYQQHAQQGLDNISRTDLWQMVNLVGEVYSRGGREERFLRMRLIFEPLLMARLHRQLSEVLDISDEARSQIETTIDSIYTRSIEAGQFLLQAHASDPALWRGVAAIHNEYLKIQRDPAEKQKLHEIIEKLYSDGLAANPDSVAMVTLYCQHLLQTGRSEEAQQRLQDLLANSPEDQKQEIRLQMAGMYRLLKDVAKSQEILEEVIENDPENLKALGLLSDSFVSQNEYEKAITVIVKLRELKDSSQLIARQSELLLRLKRFDDAGALLSQARESYPDDVLVLTVSSQWSINTTDYAQAIMYADQALKLKPNSILAYELKARALYYDQQIDAAIEVIRQLRQVAGLNSVAGRPFLAQLYLAQSRYGDAIDELHAVLRIAPNNTAVRKQLIGVMTQGKRWVELEALYDETLKLFPYSIDVHLQAAISASNYASLLRSKKQDRLAAGQYAKSQKLLDETAQLCQQQQVTSNVFLNPQIQLYLKTGQYEKVLSTLDPLFAERGEHPLFLLHKAEALNRMGQSEQALEVFEKALEFTKDDPQLNAQVLDAAGRVGSIESMLAWAQDKVSQRPDWVALHILMAKMYSAMGESEKALSAYEAALKYVEDTGHIVNLKYAQSVIYLQMNRWDKSIELSREVLSLNPDHLTTLNNLAYLLMEQGGDGKEAVQLARRAHELNRSNPDVADTYATALLIVEKYEDAENLLRRAIQQKQRDGSPVWAEFHYHLGQALVGSGQNEAARQQFENALQQIERGKLTSDKETFRQEVEAARDQL